MVDASSEVTGACAIPGASTDEANLDVATMYKSRADIESCSSEKLMDQVTKRDLAYALPYITGRM